MIIAKTRMKKIPENCNKCQFFCCHFGFGADAKSSCSITGDSIKKEYNAEKRNWCNVKPNRCPLIEVKE